MAYTVASSGLRACCVLLQAGVMVPQQALNQVQKVTLAVTATVAEAAGLLTQAQHLLCA